MRIKLKLKQTLVLFVAAGSCFLSARVQSANSINTVVNDMKYNHEGTLHGLPSSVFWATKPRASKTGAWPEANAILFWNHVYEPDTLNPSWKARVQMRNPRVYTLYNDNKWYLTQSANSTDGRSYREDYGNNDESQAADVTWSSEGWPQVKVGSKSSTGTGWNYHGWLTWRAGINGTTIRGVFATCEARLVGDSNGKYLFGVGADYYTATSGGYNLYDVGIGRLKWVTSSWRSFNMHNLSESAIRLNPPPLNQ